MLRKLKWQLPGEPLAARCNWCQGPVPGRGPAVQKDCYTVSSTQQHSGKTFTNTTCMKKFVTLNSGNACYSFVRIFCLLSKNKRNKIYETANMPLVLYGCKTWSLKLREHRPRVFENGETKKRYFSITGRYYQQTAEYYLTRSFVVCISYQ